MPRGGRGAARAASPASEAEREANERRREEAGGAGSSEDWQWTLNWDAVTSDGRVTVGSCPRSPGDLERVAAEAGCTAVLCLQCDDCHRALLIDGAELAREGTDLGLKMVRVPIRDFDHGDQGLMLPEAVRILAALLESGHHVYVHCTAGINRASLVAVGWLTFVEGLRLEEAVEQVKGRRAQAHPYLDSWYAAKDIILGPHGARLTALAEAQYQARCERGEEGDSASDWRRAERQLLQDLFRRKVACDLSLAGAFEAVGPALDSAERTGLEERAELAERRAEAMERELEETRGKAAQLDKTEFEMRRLKLQLGSIKTAFNQVYATIGSEGSGAAPGMTRSGAGENGAPQGTTNGFNGVAAQGANSHRTEAPPATNGNGHSNGHSNGNGNGNGNSNGFSAA